MSSKNEKPDLLTLDSTKRLARADTLKIKKLSIKSPNVTKMHRVTYGNTTYYFYTKKKMRELVNKNRHYTLLGLHLEDFEQHKPTITEKFTIINQNLENYGKPDSDPVM